MSDSAEALQQRVERIRALMERNRLDACVIRRNPNLAWLTGGRVHVPTTLDQACLDIIVRADSVTAVTNTIEAPRLQAEELPQEIDLQSVPWWENRDQLLPTGEKIGSDQPGGDRIDLGVEIEMLRGSLVPYDVERLRSVSEDSALALEEAMRTVVPADREIEVAGNITNALWRRNLEIVYLGVAGEERVQKYRHALPSESVVGKRVVASICARQKGLICSTTRIVSFEEWNQRLEDEYTGILGVESAILDATAVGVEWREPVEAAIGAYGQFGFDPEEWKKHHQGGPTGYLPRDLPATPSNRRLIQKNQPVAWNPTGKGWKAEDTFLAGETGLELLTRVGNWPVRTFGGRARPEVLRLPVV